MNQNMGPQPNSAPGYNPAQPITVVLVNDMSQADSYTINPNSSMLFMNYAMTEFKMRSRDMNGFPSPDRTWTMKETTPQPAPVNTGNFVTKEEFNNMTTSMNEQFDKLFKMLQ